MLRGVEEARRFVSRRCPMVRRGAVGLKNVNHTSVVALRSSLVSAGRVAPCVREDPLSVSPRVAGELDEGGAVLVTTMEVGR